MSRADAASIGGMDRQTLRDWVHRYNQADPDGLFDHWAAGPPSRLSDAQKAELSEIVETGPNAEVDGVARWRRVDLQRVMPDPEQPHRSVGNHQVHRHATGRTSVNHDGRWY
jgi:hypothetical protein